LSLDEQRRILEPPAGARRRVILATSIAETSLTVPRVTMVVDAGLARGSHYNPRSGMDGLVTSSVSQAQADQRRGDHDEKRLKLRVDGKYGGAKIGVLGLNGSGKSSLLKILAGVDKDFMGNATTIRCFRVNYENDARVMANVLREKPEEMMQLPDFHFQMQLLLQLHKFF